MTLNFVFENEVSHSEFSCNICVPSFKGLSLEFFFDIILVALWPWC